MNEIFTLVGWVGAILLTLYFTPVCKEYMYPFIGSKTLAALVTAAVIFLLSLAVFGVITYFFGESIKQSRLNAIDRSLGFGFGLFRGVLLLGLAYIVISFIWEKDEQPTWMVDARSHTLVEGTADWLKEMMPKDTEDTKKKSKSVEDKIINLGDKAADIVKDAKDVAVEKGYDKVARDSLNGLIEKADKMTEKVDAAAEAAKEKAAEVPPSSETLAPAPAATPAAPAKQ